MNLTRVPDPQRDGETMLRGEETITCPVCGKSGRVYSYIRETSKQKAAEIKMRLGMSEEDAYKDSTLRMPHNAQVRKVYPKGWYQLLLFPYKDFIADLDKVCSSHMLRPSDGYGILQENEYQDYLKWTCKDCATKLLQQLIDENETFEQTMETDFIEQIMNR